MVDVAAAVGGVIGGLILACCLTVCLRVAQLRYKRRKLMLASGLDADERRFKRRLEMQMAEVDGLFDDEEVDNGAGSSGGGGVIAGDDDGESDLELNDAEVAQLQLLERELARQPLENVESPPRALSSRRLTATPAGKAAAAATGEAAGEASESGTGTAAAARRAERSSASSGGARGGESGGGDSPAIEDDGV